MKFLNTKGPAISGERIEILRQEKGGAGALRATASSPLNMPHGPEAGELISPLQRRYKIILGFLMILAPILLIASIFIGRYSLSPAEIIAFILGKAQAGGIKHSVLLDIRIPRAVSAFVVGMGLSLAGAAYQAVLTNPLASPDVLGTSSAASFGAAAGILFFPASFALTCLFSFTAGLLGIVLVLAISSFKGDKEIITVVLSGMIVSSIFMSFISLIKYLADPEDTLPAITFWLMGSFASINGTQALLVAPFFLLCIGLLILLRWKLNILSLGDDEAIVAGINPQRLRIMILGIASLIVALSVTISGSIGWVGLVIPHLCRSFVGYNHGRLLPTAALTGGIFLLMVDNLARAMSVAEIPIGMLTSLIGAPLFLILFLRDRGARKGN